jgi:hypothetical protein
MPAKIIIFGNKNSKDAINSAFTPEDILQTLWKNNVMCKLFFQQTEVLGFCSFTFIITNNVDK